MKPADAHAVAIFAFDGAHFGDVEVGFEEALSDGDDGLGPGTVMAALVDRVAGDVVDCGVAILGGADDETLVLPGGGTQLARSRIGGGKEDDPGSAVTGNAIGRSS